MDTDRHPCYNEAMRAAFRCLFKVPQEGDTVKRSEVLKRLRMEAQRAVRAIRDVEKDSVPMEFGLSAAHNSANAVISLCNLVQSGRLEITAEPEPAAEGTAHRGRRRKETVPLSDNNS